MKFPACMTGAMLAMAILAPAAGAAATKADEGFAALVLPDGTPRNRITRARAGDEVAHFIKWKEKVPPSTLRCVITGPGTNIDESGPFQTDDANEFSVCTLETEVTDDGEYTFTQYLDGQKVGQSSITLDKVSFLGRMTRRREGKWILGFAALLVLGIYWVRRRMTGDKRSLGQLARGESGAERAVAIAVATKGAASGLDARRVTIGSQAREPAPADPVEEFRKRLAADAAHRPASAEEAWSIARSARKSGDSATAVAALRGFDKAWPGHALVPEVYVFSARMMAEDLGNIEMARRIAQHVIQKYPGHFAAPEAKRLLESLPQPG